MKLQKPETQHKLPAVIITNVPEGCDEAQTVVFMRDDASARSHEDLFYEVEYASRDDARTGLNGLMAA